MIFLAVVLYFVNSFVCLFFCGCFATALAFLGVKWELEDIKSDSEMNCDSITMPKIEAVLQQ